MTGFFKKLFNRITGRGKEEPKPEEQVALPPPAPEPEPEPVAEEVAPPRPPPPEPVKPFIAEKAPELPKAEKPIAKAKAKEPPPKIVAKPASKKPEPKKPEPKKPEPKKPEPKKAEVKKPESKKEVLKGKPGKKAEPPKPVAKEAKAPQKKPEPKRPEVKKPEPKPAPKAEAPLPKAKPVVVEATPLPPPAPKPLVVEAPPPPPKLAVVEKSPPPPPPPEPEPEPVEVVGPEPFESEPPPPPPVVVRAPEPVVQEPERKGWFARLRDGLSKSSKSITSSITSIFTKRKLDAATLQELEDVLIQADLGITVSERIIKAVSAGRYDKEIDPDEVKTILASEVAKVLKPVEVPFNFGEEKPFVILVVGVNGSGKTTTIGKLGAIASGEGFKVMFAACDTFRAAAIEQLTIWGQRIGARTMARPTGSDASGLAYDAMKEAAADGTDILFVDTAGRLHNKAYLMDELDKVVRVIKKLDENAPHAVLLVLDATTGQNAIAQAEAFTKVAGVTGIIMTKLDGTARGGILVAIAEKYKLPIHAVGVGEKIDDLQPFDADAFSRAIAGLEDA
jgi:fused signal recognition particle receptor